MSLFTLFWVSLATFLLIHYAVAPAFAAWMRRDRSPRAVVFSGWLAMLGAIRATALISLLTTAVLLLLFFLVDRFAGATPESVEAALLSLEGMRNRLFGFGQFWGGLMTALLVLGMAIYAYRKGCRQMNEALARVVNAQVVELSRQQLAGTLEPLEPTKEMKILANQREEMEELRRGTDADSTLDSDDKAARLTAIDAVIHSTKADYARVDVLRRVKPEISEADAELPKPRNTWERFQTFFISVGLLRCCGLGTRLVYAVALMVLIPSLLGAYSPSTKKTLDGQLIRLNDLRLTLAEKEVDTHFSTAVSAAAERDVPSDIDEEDDAVLQEVAALLESATLVAEDFGAETLDFANQYTLAASVARQQILELAAKRPDVAFSNTPRLSELDGLSPYEKRLISRFEAADSAPRPKTKVGRQLHSRLRQAAGRSPRLMARVRADLKAFQRPATRVDLRSALVGDLSEGRLPELPSQQQAVLQRTQQFRANNALSRYVSGRTDLGTTLADAAVPDRVINRALQTADLIDLRSNFRRTLNRQVQSSRQIATSLRSQPPASVANASPRMNMDVASRAAGRLRNYQAARLGPLARSSAAADALATYTDYFPHRAGADTTTARGRLMSRWNPEFARSARTQSRFLRASSFSQLRGFSRVGGVLIGREPAKDDTAQIDFVDLHWQWVDGRIQLTLIDAQQQQYKTRPHHPRIAYHALVYAADGRPLTVTVVKSGIPGVRSVMLHPTLVDTPLGDRMIRLDNFVYDFIRDEQQVLDARQLVDDHQLLYQLAWAARMSQFLDPTVFPAEEAQEILEQEKARAEAIVTLMLSDKGLYLERLSAVLDDATAFGDPERSPLPKMKDFFDQRLVKLMQQAAEQTSSPSDFAAYISSESQRQWQKFAELVKAADPSDLVQQIDAGDLTPEAAQAEFARRAETAESAARDIYTWAFPVPEFQEASGVREMEFWLRPEYVVFHEAPTPRELLRFTVQLACSSPAYFGADLEAESAAEPMGEPWEFDGLRELVEHSVEQGLASDPRKAEILSDAAEFTGLQRLFRLAFEGRLGAEFPVRKLASLTSELSRRLPPLKYQTPRWDIPDADRTLDVWPEIQLAVTVLAAFGDGIDPEVLAGRSDGEYADNLLLQLAKACDEHDRVSTIVVDERMDVLQQHQHLLARRLRDAASLLTIVANLKAKEAVDAGDRQAFQKAFESYVDATAKWLEDWTQLGSELDNSFSSEREVSEGDKIGLALSSIAETSEMILLAQSLGIQEALRTTLCETVFRGDELPPM